MPSGPDFSPQEQTMIMEALDNKVRGYVLELYEEKEAMAIYTRDGVTGVDSLHRVKFLKGEIARTTQLMNRLSQAGWKL